MLSYCLNQHVSNGARFTLKVNSLCFHSAMHSSVLLQRIQCRLDQSNRKRDFHCMWQRDLGTAICNHLPTSKQELLRWLPTTLGLHDQDPREWIYQALAWNVWWHHLVFMALNCLLQLRRLCCYILSEGGQNVAAAVSISFKYCNHHFWWAYNLPCLIWD